MLSSDHKKEIEKKDTMKKKSQESFLYIKYLVFSFMSFVAYR